MNDYEIDLCSKMLVHAFHSERTQNLKASEIKTTLAIFFDDEVIQKAVERITGKTPNKAYTGLAGTVAR